MHQDSGQTKFRTLHMEQVRACDQLGQLQWVWRCLIFPCYIYRLKVGMGTQARLLAATQCQKLPWLLAPLLKQSLPPSLPQELQLEPTLNRFEKLLGAIRCTQATSTAVLCRSAADTPLVLLIVENTENSTFELSILA